MTQETSTIIRVLRLPLMIMVVFIHCRLSFGGGEGLFYLIQLLFSEIFPSVAVPIFMFLAGYLFFAKIRQPNYEFYSRQFHKRIRTLVLPYIYWNLIVIAIFYSLHKFLPSIINPEFENIPTFSFLQLLNCFWGESGGFPIAYQFWFIRNLIIFVILTPLLYLLLKRQWTSCVYGAVLIGVILFNIGGGWLTTLLYFSIGIYMSIHEVDFVSISKRYRLILLLFSLIVLVVWSCGYESKPLRICYILTTSTYILSSRFLLKQNLVTKLLNKLSDTSFFIYAFHAILAGFLCKIIELIIDKFNLTTEIFLVFIYFINVIINVLICSAVYMALKRCWPKLLSTLAGGR